MQGQPFGPWRSASPAPGLGSIPPVIGGKGNGSPGTGGNGPVLTGGHNTTPVGHILVNVGNVGNGGGGSNGGNGGNGIGNGGCTGTVGNVGNVVGIVSTVGIVNGGVEKMKGGVVAVAVEVVVGNVAPGDKVIYGNGCGLKVQYE